MVQHVMEQPKREEVEPRGTTKFSLPFSVLAVSQHKFKKEKETVVIKQTL